MLGQRGKQKSRTWTNFLLLKSHQSGNLVLVSFNWHGEWAMTVAANNTAVPKAVPRDPSSCSAVYIGLFFKWRKKEQPRWEFCASVAIERWGNKLLNLSNHTVPREFLKWGWSKTLKFEPRAHIPSFNIWWDSLLQRTEYKCLLITGPTIISSCPCAFPCQNVNGIKISIHSSQFSCNKISLKAGREEKWTWKRSNSWTINYKDVLSANWTHLSLANALLFNVQRSWFYVNCSLLFFSVTISIPGTSKASKGGRLCKAINMWK